MQNKCISKLSNALSGKLMEYIYKILKIMLSRETLEVYPRNFAIQFPIPETILWGFFFSGDTRLVVDETFPLGEVFFLFLL